MLSDQDNQYLEARLSETLSVRSPEARLFDNFAPLLREKLKAKLPNALEQIGDPITFVTVSPPTNSNVYDKRLSLSANYKKVPQSIYLYYVTFGDDGLPVIEHHFHDHNADINEQNITSIISKVITDSNTGAGPAPTGGDFFGIEWSRVSYLAFVVDSDHWRMWKYFNEQENREEIGLNFNFTQASTANHSFYDAVNLSVPITNKKGVAVTRDAIAFINHLKADSMGRELGAGKPQDQLPEKQFFAFDLYMVVGKDPTKVPSSMFIIDPGGENMGPPTGAP